MAEKKQKEMTLEEARAYRESLYVPVERKLTDEEKREQFRLFWAQEKKKYGKNKDLENIIWIHLQAVKLDDPENFEKGLNNFGFKK